MDGTADETNAQNVTHFPGFSFAFYMSAYFATSTPVGHPIFVQAQILSLVLHDKISSKTLNSSIKLGKTIKSNFAQMWINIRDSYDIAEIFEFQHIKKHTWLRAYSSKGRNAIAGQNFSS